jgi:small-conductance mechanosensitive channel
MKKQVWLESAESWLSKLLRDLGIPPAVVVAALILLAGVVVAVVCRHLTRKLVTRATEWLARWAGPSASGSSPRFGNVAAVYWGVLALAVMTATETLGLPVVTGWLGKVTSYVPRVVAAAAIVGVGLLGARVVRQLVTSAATSAKLRSAERLGRLVEVGLVVGVALLAVEQLGIEVSLLKTSVVVVLATVLGGAALAFGLGSRELVANILSAHFVQKAYQPGQRIRVGDVEGQILRITETAVVVETADGEISLPARELADSRSTLIVHGSSTQ